MNRIARVCRSLVCIVAIGTLIPNSAFSLALRPLARATQGDPAWMAESDQVEALFGTSVASAGDVNGDGYGDVIIGAPGYPNLPTNKGRAFVYLGAGAGLATTAAWIAEDDQWSSFGFSVASAGDVNGDGFADVIIGAHNYLSASGEGRAYVYQGSSSGLSATAAWTADGDHSGAWFGASVASAGDVNGDGFSDVIVGADGHSASMSYGGRAFVFLGSASGLATSSSWEFASDQDFARLGQSVASAGDVNGDGYADVIVGAPYYQSVQANEGRAYLFYGSASGLVSTAGWIAEGQQNGAHFGTSVAPAGDVNGDGYADVIVGAPRFGLDTGQHFEGRAFVYLGSSSGLSSSAAWTVDGNQNAAGLGCSVASAGDVNGDAYGDVIVGVLTYGDGQLQEGRALVYLGSPAGLSTNFAWTDEGDQDYANFGHSVASAADVDADGRTEVLVGAWMYDNGETNEGRAYLYRDVACVEIGVEYCTANPNSTGNAADISASCSSSAAAGALQLFAAPVPNKLGLFFHGQNPVQVPFGNGNLCTSGSIVRGALTQAVGNRAAYLYDNSDPKHSLGAYVGSTRNFQFWFRDPAAGGAAFNLSNAVSITIQP